MTESLKHVRKMEPGPPKVRAPLEAARFQTHLLDTVEQAVIATDLDGIVTYWNQFAQQLYGWKSQEAVGRHIMELTTPEVMTNQALEIMARLRQGASWTGEFRVQRRDGTTFRRKLSTHRLMTTTER